MNDFNEPKKSSARAAAMAKTWAARREFAANPVCCCGCGTKLAVGKDPEHQRLFCQGTTGGSTSCCVRYCGVRRPDKTFRWRLGRIWHGSSSFRKTEKS